MATIALSARELCATQRRRTRCHASMRGTVMRRGVCGRRYTQTELLSYVIGRPSGVCAVGVGVDMGLRVRVSVLDRTETILLYIQYIDERR